MLAHTCHLQGNGSTYTICKIVHTHTANKEHTHTHTHTNLVQITAGAGLELGWSSIGSSVLMTQVRPPSALKIFFQCLVQTPLWCQSICAVHPLKSHALASTACFSCCYFHLNTMPFSFTPLFPFIRHTLYTIISTYRPCSHGNFHLQNMLFKPLFPHTDHAFQPFHVVIIQQKLKSNY